MVHFITETRIRLIVFAMLTLLRIKNLALASDVRVELGAGYNAITGETGAGKSLLIGGLNLVLGERADRNLIRTGAESCAVEATFDVTRVADSVAALLESNGLESCEENLLLIKRTLTTAGTNRQFVNGSPTTLGTLVELGSILIDIHGPHDHQSLLHPRHQLAILDAYGNLTDQRSSVNALLSKCNALESSKTALIVDEKTYAQQLDLLGFQATEIENAGLRPDEEVELEIDFYRAQNSVKLATLTQSGLNILDSEDFSVFTQLELLGKKLVDLRKLDPGTQTMAENHLQVMEQLSDLRHELSGYSDKLDIDSDRVAQLEDRITLLHNLKRKYGSTLAEVIQFGHRAKSQLADLEQRETEITRLNIEIHKANELLLSAACELATSRRNLLPSLKNAVEKQLQDLGFPQSHFEIALATTTLSATGSDIAEFLFSPNPGEPPKPLRLIASSGEMARVMLAIKTVLASVDQIPLLVFDEVDANVGGETAYVVGEKMRQIGRQRQVICITHLPPVAAAAVQHFVVTKSVHEGRTTSIISLLNHDERITEIARMLGGQTIAARQHAEEMLRFQ